MKNKKLYTEDSIKSISPREFTRLHPGTYAGSTEYSTQLLKEVFANALDEHNIGNGNLIKVTYLTKDNRYIIEDEAQGLPTNISTDNNRTVVEDVFSRLNTSGKYDENGIYGASALGLNGIGLKLVCYLSSYSYITTSDGKGYRESLIFKDGLLDSRNIEKEKIGVHGTKIEYIPDAQFFQHKEIDIKDIKKLFKEIAALCPQLTIEFLIDDKMETYHSINGLNDIVNDYINNNEILDHRFNCNIIKGDNLINLCLTYTSNLDSKIISYVNYGPTEEGVHITALKTNLTKTFNKYAKENNLLKEKEENLTGQELGEGLIVAFNLKANGVQYDSQSKTRIVGIDRTLINEAINIEFLQWLKNFPSVAKIIAERALLSRKAREAAKKARDAVRNVQKKKEKALKFDSKLADCYSKQRSKCELYITEGDSASGNLKTARNNEFQAVMPVRGKILNTQKATLAQIQKNAEIMTMIDAFGLTIDPKTMKLTYNKSDLRYGKIIIMSDADVDGAHIKNLFYTFIWNFCPDLIKDGYIYAGVPPLYKVTIGKKYKYLKNDEALEQFRKENAGKKYTVNRLKG